MAINSVLPADCMGRSQRERGPIWIFKWRPGHPSRKRCPNNAALPRGFAPFFLILSPRWIFGARPFSRGRKTSGIYDAGGNFFAVFRATLSMVFRVFRWWAPIWIFNWFCFFPVVYDPGRMFECCNDKYVWSVRINFSKLCWQILNYDTSAIDFVDIYNNL